MDYNFDNERPIYIQLAEQLKADIVSGKLKKGEKIPSVREFAMLVKVNPNTMQKALLQLENEKLIYTERTNGKYVTSDREVINSFKNAVINEKVDNFLADMKNMGIGSSEVIEYLLKRERNDNN